jgi:hypothetical protein
VSAADVNRIAELERQVARLKARIIALERLVGNTVPEHEADREAVQKKAVYDWQGQRPPDV